MLSRLCTRLCWTMIFSCTQSSHCGSCLSDFESNADFAVLRAGAVDIANAVLLNHLTTSGSMKERAYAENTTAARVANKVQML